MVYVSWPQLASIARRYWAQSPWYPLRRRFGRVKTPATLCDAGATADSPAPNHEHSGDAVKTREGIH